MTAAACTVGRDFATGISTITVNGQLDESALVGLIAAVRRAMLDAPLAIVVDLDDARIVRATALRTLSEVVAPGRTSTQLLLCAEPASATGRIVYRMLGRLFDICPAVPDAVAVVTRRPSPAGRRHRLLPAHPSSAAVARRTVSAACRDWRCDDLTDDAVVITSELVSNAIEHAGTELDLTVAQVGGTVWLGVRDRDPRGPHMPPPDSFPDGRAWRGRGLAIVNVLARDWGFAEADDGKTVWAAVGPEPARWPLPAS
ncbi:ATP-binding protein [Polymorphospora sp. NPDC050346]|uniref:ATP-binding protein n=1 Tax=Polymorphospora sp. NPDC050346 TaxID=3155780 RepID=UPI0033C499B0